MAEQLEDISIIVPEFKQLIFTNPFDLNISILRGKSHQQLPWKYGYFIRLGIGDKARHLYSSGYIFSRSKTASSALVVQLSEIYTKYNSDELIQSISPELIERIGTDLNNPNILVLYTRSYLDEK